jgi:type VI secretion system protein
MVLAALVIPMGACLFHRAPVRTRSFVIQASAQANDNAPTRVDAVMIYRPAALTALLAMTAAQWFDSREQMRNDFPNAFEVHEWEVVPGGRVDVSKLPFRQRGLGLVVFANYRGPGNHRTRIDIWRKATILLQDRTITVLEKR